MMGALLLLAGPVWAINKCTGADGKVAFQDAACPNAINPPIASKSSLVKASEPKAPRPPMGDEEYERQRAAVRIREIDAYAKSRGAAIKEAAEADTAKCGSGTREPHVGASAVWIRTCSTWGGPKSINTTTTGLGETQQWGYLYNRYIYFNVAQVVTVIQH